MASIAGSTVQFEIEGEKAAGETSKSRKKSCLPSLLSLLCLAFAILLAVFIVLYIKESGKKAEKVPGFRESVVFRHHKLNLDISRSIVKGSTWLKEQQDVDGKWIDHHTTGNAISILKLTGRDFNSERALSYIKKLNGTLHLLDGGKLASVITGLRSLCIDTSYFTGTNLNNMLLEKIKSFPKGSFNHPFQYSLAVIGLRLSNSIIPHSVIGKLISDGDRVQDGDTLALISMALSGVASQGTIPMGKMWSVKSKIRKILNKLEAKMFSKNTTMNIYTKSLVMQAFASENKNFAVDIKKYNALYQDLLRQQKPDGSFVNVRTALHVLPALAGASLLDIPSTTCQTTGNTTLAKSMIKVCVKVEFKAGNYTNPPEQMVRILNGSTGIAALRAASRLHQCYGFTFKWTSWGPSIQSICKIKINHDKKFYWMFYVNNKMASVGVGSYKPNENECIVMKYKKANW